MAENTANRSTASASASAERHREFRPRGPRSWSPLQPGTSYDADEDRYWLEREMTLLERALADKGEMKRSELGDTVGCKYWGPRRYARALKVASDLGTMRI